MTEVIYLDHNASTPLDPRVAEAMFQCDREGYANPSSAHQAGRSARRRLEEARDHTAQLLGAQTTGMETDRLIYTSGGAEANNLALLGLAGYGAGPDALPNPRKMRIIVSAIEHPTLAGAAEFLLRQGLDVQTLRVGGDGVIDLDHLRQLLETPTHLVSVMLGNNETGVLQPVAQAAALAKQAGALVHTDAVQAVGKIAVNFRALGVDALSFTAHKFHGPRGIGGLLIGPHTPLAPIMHGGFQQEGLRPGAESVTLAVGLDAALTFWEQEAEPRAARMKSLRDRFEQAIVRADSRCVVNGQAALRLPHTSNIAFCGLDRQALFMALDMAGVACSTGSACASGSNEPSPVLLAMNCDPEIVQGSLRFSFGAGSTMNDVEQAVNKILHCLARMRG